MKNTVILLVGAAVLLGGALWFIKEGGDPEPGGAEPLFVFCAAGLKKPLEAAAKLYTEETGIPVQFQFGGSATLLSQLQVAKKGDLFVAADDGTMGDAKKRDLVAEVIPVLKQVPVIAVQEGNPHGIDSLQDLLQPELKVAVSNPEAASIGKTAKQSFGDQWEQMAAQVAVMKPTVNEIASDLSLGVVDAAIVWEAMANQFDNLDSVHVAELDALAQVASIGVLKSAQDPTAALRFARFLTAPEKGNSAIEANGFEPVPGDEWAAKPELILYSGGVNRPAVEKLLISFAEREGVEVTTVFNGCGILCAAMDAMTSTDDPKFPDAYYACDLCFVPPVAEVFPEVTLLTETDIGIVVPKDNPHNVRTLVDLTQPGLRVGICNAKQSTIGYMTDGIIRDSGLKNAIMKNVVVQVPTADFLINQMRGGALDAAIVYRVNADLQKEHLSFTKIDHPGAVAVQPYGVRGDSPNRLLAGRLLDHMLANEEAFTSTGFTWRGEEEPVASKDLEVPPWLLPEDEKQAQN